MAFKAQYEGLCQAEDGCILGQNGRVKAGEMVIGLGPGNGVAHYDCMPDGEYDGEDSTVVPDLEMTGKTTLRYDEVKDRPGDRPTKYKGTTLEDMGF